MTTCIEDGSDIIDAIESWSNRAEVRYETLTNYSSAPPASAFHQADLSELEEISRNINESEESSLQTEHSKSAWEVDRRYCTKAIELARSGKTVFVAEDEDGYYFATTGCLMAPLMAEIQGDNEMANVIWQGTVDNLELSGMPNGDACPMRVVEDADGRLITEWPNHSEDEQGEIVYDTSAWFADYQVRFRDMRPAPSPDLRQQMIDNKILDN